MQEKEKIAIIDHVGSKAGMDYYTYFLAKGLTDQSKIVGVFSNFIKSDLDIHFFNFFIGHTTSKIKKLCNHILAFLKTTIACRRYGYNQAVVHLFTYGLKDIYALGILKIFGIKTIAIVHDVESFASKDYPLSQKIILLYLTNKLIVHNQFSFEILEQKWGNKISAKTKIISHGNFHTLPDLSFGKAQARSSLLLNPNKIYLLFFGQIKEVKGLEILIKALALLPSHFILIIAGKPWKNNFGTYQELIDNLKLEDRVEKHIEFIQDSKRDILFKACDLLILPYKQIFQSGVMLMAMSYKIPIIASNLNPMKELIKERQTGFLFESEDELSLSKSIENAASDLTLLPRIAEEAWEITNKQNDWKQVAFKIINW